MNKELKVELSKKFEEFKEIPFPSFPEDLEVVAELDLAESNLMGNISTYLSGGNKIIKPENVSDIEKAVQNYKIKNEEESGYIRDIHNYISKIKDLNKIIDLINNK